MKLFLVFICLALLTALTMSGQQTTKLTLQDKVSGVHVAYAHVLAEILPPAKGKSITQMTNEKGEAEFSISSPVRVSTSFIGYVQAIDTLYPGKAITLLLQPLVYNVDEVVVTGQISPERVDKSIYKVQTLGTMTINQKAANTLSDLLSGELNIRTTHSSVFGSSVMMQGMGGEHVKFLIDGVPVIGRQNGELDLDQMSMQNVDHVEIIEGPMSVIYGSNALAGVINVITKSPDRRKASLGGEVYIESVGVYNLALSGSYSKGKSSVSFNGSRNFFSGFSVVDTSRNKEWNPKLQYDSDISYLYTAKKTTAKITLGYFNELIRDYGDPSPIFNWDKALDRYFYTNRLTARGEFNQKVFKTGNLNVVSAYSYYNRVKNTYLKNLTNLEKSIYIGDDAQDTTWFDNFLIRPVFSNSRPNELLKYQMGFDINYERGGGKRVDDQQQEIGDYAAFLSLAYTPLPQISIQPGIRVIYNTQYEAPLVYSLNLKWNILEELIVRGSLAKGFRAPSLKELYLYFVDSNHEVRGNPNLIAETSMNYSMDITYNTQTAAAYNWGIDFGLFYNHMRNKIELAKNSGGNLAYTYVNIDQYYTQGFDLKFNNRVYPGLKLILGYGVVGRKLLNNTMINGGKFHYSNDFTVQSNVTWRQTGLEFSTFFKYNGSFPELILQESGRLDIRTINSYNTLDINVSRWFLQRSLNVQVGAKNLFDVTNVSSSGYTESETAHSGTGSPLDWGRTYFVKLQFNIFK